MPIITNKKTKVRYSVSNEDVDVIIKNPHVAKGYIIDRVQVPDEVKALIEMKKAVAKPAETPKKKRNQKPTK